MILRGPELCRAPEPCTQRQARRLQVCTARQHCVCLVLKGFPIRRHLLARLKYKGDDCLEEMRFFHGPEASEDKPPDVNECKTHRRDPCVRLSGPCRRSIHALGWGRASHLRDGKPIWPPRGGLGIACDAYDDGVIARQLTGFPDSLGDRDGECQVPNYKWVDRLVRIN